MTAVLADRLELVRNTPLLRGGHEAPGQGQEPCGMCVMEAYAYVTGQPWTDHPKNCSPVIGALLRSYNDSTDQAGRDEIGTWVFDNLDALASTVGDGRDRARGYMAADYACRVVVPAWLGQVAGREDVAQELRDFARVTDAASARAARAKVLEARDGLPGWDGWYAWRQELRAKVKSAVIEALKDRKPAATAATAATAAATAATAAAATAATTATTATAAAAAAAAATAATATAHLPYGKVYDTVYAAVRERMTAFYAERFSGAVVPIKAGMIALLDEMVAPADAEVAAA